MTSDAKIGLLLGLIFIFIIAFILNGLPGLHGRSNSNQATAQDLSNLSSSSSDSPLVQPTGVASSLGAPAYRGDQEVRYQMPLGGTTTADKGVVAAPVADEQVRSVEVASADEAVTSEPLVSDGGLVEISSEVLPLPSVDTAVSGSDDPVAVDTSSSEASKAGTEYTIQSGDSPAKIAIKFYGPQEGNRLANIDKLMAANKIADPTKLKVGKKLVIPALPSGPEKLTMTNPESFVKVDSMTAKSTTATKAPVKSETKSSGTKEYVVAQGDSPAKIAMRFYGPQEGNRLVNIDRLMAANKIADPTKLKVGQMLVIPALPK